MAKLLTGSIDVSKIKKELIQTTNAAGEPFKNGGKFVNVSIWINDEEDQFGNIASVQQYTGKDGEKVYIGNLKDFKKEGEAKKSEEPAKVGEDDLPF